MKTFEIQATVRETTGSKNAKELRAKGMIPCVLYGGDSQYHFYADERQLGKLVFTPEVFNVKLTLGDQPFSTLVKDIQFHPVSDKITHIDFLQISETKPAIVSLPVHIAGTAAGVKAGGRLKLNQRKISVEGIASELPDRIEINVEELKIGDSVRVKDLQYPILKFVDSPETIVVGVRTQRKVEEEVVATPAAGAAAAPAAGAAPTSGAAAPAAGTPAPGAPAAQGKGKAEAKPEGKGKK